MKAIISEQKKICCDCKHFIQHYIFDEFSYKMYGNCYYNACGYGHCVYPRMKSKRQQQKACERFEKRKE